MILFTVSNLGQSVLDRLQSATGIRGSEWTRVAFGLSLRDLSPLPLQDFDSAGKYFHDNVFYKSDKATFHALLREHLSRPASDSEVESFIKPHVERGLDMLNHQLGQCAGSGERLMIWLVSEASSGISSPAASSQTDNSLIRLVLGQSVQSGKEIAVSLNGQGTSPHVAIMGRSGSGKTRCAKSLLLQIASNNSLSVPVLLFDYAKGDIAADSELVRSLDATVLSLPEALIPISPLQSESNSDLSLKQVATRFRDTVASVVRLGAKQRSTCTALVEQAIRESESRSPNLSTLLDVAETWYREKGLAHDSLLATLKEIADFPLFQSSNDLLNREILETSHIIDIHKLPDGVRKIAVFLVLDSLYAQLWSMPDAPIDESGNRECRLIVVVDEAHHFLSCKHPTLEKLVREGRSKGVSVWLLSQSPDDFDQPKYNFTREIGLTIVFSCAVDRPRVLEPLIGSGVDSSYLAQLGTGVALTRLSDHPAPVAVQVWR